MSPLTHPLLCSLHMDALVALGITNYALWIIRNTRSALFTKDGCTVCKAAMKVLKRLGKTIGIVDKDVTVIDLDKRPDKEKIIRELEQLTGSNTVPQLFVNERHVGGLDNIKNEYKNRTLHKEYAIARAMDKKTCVDCEIKNVEKSLRMRTQHGSQHDEHTQHGGDQRESNHSNHNADSSDSDSDF